MPPYTHRNVSLEVSPRPSPKKNLFQGRDLHGPGRFSEYYTPDLSPASTPSDTPRTRTPNCGKKNAFGRQNLCHQDPNLAFRTQEDQAESPRGGEQGRAGHGNPSSFAQNTLARAASSPETLMLTVGKDRSIGSSAPATPEKKSVAEEKIYVAVRVRPMNQREMAQGDAVAWRVVDKHTLQCSLPLPDRSPYPSSYYFDHVFGPTCASSQVYEEAARDIVMSVLAGVNASIFAYGMTSSGKTFTMKSITECALVDIFSHIQRTPDREYLMRLSSIEIYNEVVRDLLNPDSGPLRLLDDPERGTVVEKATEEVVKSSLHLQQLLDDCEAQRQVGETSLNEASSRSHQIIRLTVESCPRAADHNDDAPCQVLVASLNFVDLAGSERASLTQAEGARLKEGGHINRSLLTLGTVIRKLSGVPKGRAPSHLPYRDSKLTRILQSSLGGNARTAIIATLAPGVAHLEQSRHTLSFACRAKDVSNAAVVNAVVSDALRVRQLGREVERLTAELAGVEEERRTARGRAEELEAALAASNRQKDEAQRKVQELEASVSEYEERERRRSLPVASAARRHSSARSVSRSALGERGLNKEAAQAVAEQGKDRRVSEAPESAAASSAAAALFSMGRFSSSSRTRRASSASPSSSRRVHAAAAAAAERSSSKNGLHSLSGTRGLMQGYYEITEGRRKRGAQEEGELAAATEPTVAGSSNRGSAAALKSTPGTGGSELGMGMSVGAPAEAAEPLPALGFSTGMSAVVQRMVGGGGRSGKSSSKRRTPSSSQQYKNAGVGGSHHHSHARSSHAPPSDDLTSWLMGDSARERRRVSRRAHPSSSSSHPPLPPPRRSHALVREIRQLEAMQDELGRDASLALDALCREVEFLWLDQAALGPNPAASIAQLQSQVNRMRSQQTARLLRTSIPQPATTAAAAGADADPTTGGSTDPLEPPVATNSGAGAADMDASKNGLLHPKWQRELERLNKVEPSGVAGPAIASLEQRLRTVQESLDSAVAPQQQQQQEMQERQQEQVQDGTDRAGVDGGSDEKPHEAWDEGPAAALPDGKGNGEAEHEGNGQDGLARSHEDGSGKDAAPDAVPAIAAVPTASPLARSASVDLRRMQSLFKTAAEENIESIRSYVTELKERVAKLQYQKQLLLCQVLELESAQEKGAEEEEEKEDTGKELVDRELGREVLEDGAREEGGDANVADPAVALTAFLPPSHAGGADGQGAIDADLLGESFISEGGREANFEAQMAEIVTGWRDCCVPLCHRTEFYILVHGEPSDAPYVEIERLRLAWMREQCAGGGQEFRDKELRREREHLSKRMKVRLSKGQREDLYVRWGILATSRARKAQLAALLWDNPDDTRRVEASARLVAHLLGLRDFGDPPREMLELRFMPPGWWTNPGSHGAGGWATKRGLNVR